MLVDGNTAPVVDTVSVQILAGVFMTVAALSNSTSIRLSIVRIETSARFLYPDDTTRNFEIAVILAVNFEGVTVENFSSSDQILITFEKAEVCFLLHCRLCLFVGKHTWLSAVLCMAVIIAFLYVLYRLLQAQDASFMIWQQMVGACCTYIYS